MITSLHSTARRAACLAWILFVPLSALRLKAIDWVVASGNWDVPSNWNPAVVPISGDDAVIANGGTCLFAGLSLSARAVTVGSGSSFQVTDAATLSTSDSFFVSGATGLVSDASVVTSLLTVADTPAQAGILTIQNQGHGTCLDATSDGTINVTGVNSTLQISRGTAGSFLRIGSLRPGKLKVSALAVVSCEILRIGDALDAAATGDVTVDQATLTSSSASDSTVGYLANGGLTLRNLATVTIGSAGAGILDIALRAGSTGTVNIGVAGDGLAGGALNASQLIFGAGIGTINVTSQFTLASDVLGTGTINKTGATGTLTLTKSTGPNVAINVNAGTFRIGDGVTNGTVGANTITTAAGATVDLFPASPATFSSSVTGGASLTKSGPGTIDIDVSQDYTGSTFVVAGTLRLVSSGNRPQSGKTPGIGLDSVGALANTFSVSVDNSGNVNPSTSPPSVLELNGAGASVTASQNSSGVGLVVGNSNRGMLNVRNGATLSNVVGSVGAFSGANGAVLLDAGTWNSADMLTIGSGGTGTGTVQNGGQLLTQALVRLGGSSGGNGTLNLSGATSVVRVGATGGSELRVGDAGTGNLNVSAGATLNSTGTISNTSTAIGSVIISGVGTVWNCPGLSVGPFGNGTLTIADGGLVNAAGTTVIVARNTGATGRLRLGAGALPGTLNATSVQLGRTSAGNSGNGTVEFNHTGPFTFSLPITGFNGAVVKNGSGTTTLAAAPTFAGGTTLNAGTLLLGANATLMTSLAVNSGGTLALGGFTYGTTTCTSTIAAGGTVVGPGTMRGTVTNNGTLLVNGAGNTLAFTGTVTNNGRISLGNGATLSSTGASFTNAAGGVIEVLGGTFTSPPGFVNNGLILNASIVAIASATKSGSTATFVVNGVSGRNYQLQRSAALESDVFANIGPAQPGTTGTPLTFLDQNATGTQDFYRVVSP